MVQRYDKFPKLPNFLIKICILFVISEADVVAGDAEGSPGDVEPAVAGEELVGEVVVAEEVDEALELSRIFGADVGSLADEVLRVLDTTDSAVDRLAAVAGVDEDGATDGLAGRL